MIESQIESNRQILAESRDTDTVSEDGDVLNLEMLRAKLNTLQSNYTDLHPDVIKLKAQIADLEAGQQAGKAKTPEQSRPAVETRVPVSRDPALKLVSNTLNDLMRQRVETQGEISDLAIDIEQLKHQMKNYQERVERTPLLEQELLTLKRDYDNIQESYNSLLPANMRPKSPSTWKKNKRESSFASSTMPPCPANRFHRTCESCS